MNLNNFTTEPISKLFFRYLVPSICGTMVTSIYVLADTIIIGKGIGTDAMAALNIALPVYNLFFGTGLLFGVGGSVMMSSARARGHFKRQMPIFCIFAFLLKCSCLLILYDHLQHFYKRDCPLSRSNRCHTALCDGLSSLYYMESSGLCLFLRFCKPLSEMMGRQNLQ